MGAGGENCVAVGLGSSAGFREGSEFRVGVGAVCRVGAGVGAPSEQAMAIAVGRMANMEAAASAFLNGNLMFFIL